MHAHAHSVEGLGPGHHHRAAPAPPGTWPELGTASRHSMARHAPSTTNGLASTSGSASASDDVGADSQLLGLESCLLALAPVELLVVEPLQPAVLRVLKVQYLLNARLCLSIFLV